MAGKTRSPESLIEILAMPHHTPEDLVSTSEGTRQFAVVTGASSGIGKELARQLAQKGVDLLITAEDGGITAAGQELAGLGVQVESVQVDLTKAAELENLTSRIQATGRTLDAVAINAGVGVAGPFSEPICRPKLILSIPTSSPP